MSGRKIRRIGGCAPGEGSESLAGPSLNSAFNSVQLTGSTFIHLTCVQGGDTEVCQVLDDRPFLPPAKNRYGLW